MADFPPFSSGRRQAIDNAREAWIRRLVDTSRRNNLLYFRDLRVGTLDFSFAEPEALDELLAGSKVSLTRLVPPAQDPKAALKLKEIVRKALSNLEEKGLETLYVAYGMATWPVEDDGRPPEAAVALLPVTVDGRREALSIVPSGAVRLNLALLHALQEMGIAVKEEESESAPAMLERLKTEVTAKGFEIRPRTILGNFSFQKLAMVQDLRDQDEALLANDLIAALAGDEEARIELGQRQLSVDPRELDNVLPAAEYMPLDADSSQQAVIHAVARGANGVIQGPPGCGKSQTIANTIATLVAQGRKVLFVAEKRAALEAVHKRLEARGLGHLALDLHGATVSQKQVITRIGDALKAVKSAVEPDEDELHARFLDRRERLVNHDRLMHTPLTPSGRSPYELQVALFETAQTPAKTRWHGADLARLTPDVVTKVRDLIEEAAGHSELFLRSGDSPWKDAVLADGHAAQAALNASTSLFNDLPNLRSLLAPFAAPQRLSEVEALVQLFTETAQMARRYNVEIFVEANGLIEALRPAEGGGLPALWARLTNGRYRAASARFQQLSLSGAADPVDLVNAERLDLRWKAIGVDGRTAQAPPDAIEAWDRVRDSWNFLRRALPETPPDDLANLASALANDEASARAIPRLRTIGAELEDLGVGSFVQELRREPIVPSKWAETFRHAWISSCYDAARAEHPVLASFSGTYHGEVAAQFRELDRQRVRLAADRVKRAHAEAAIGAMNAYPDQTNLVRKETQKQSRHLPLRRLLADAPEVLTAICPCWMASPLNVSQLLPADRRFFDVVIFDEASQVLPEDAVCAVLRGEQLVVAGDRHQLPPTTFFAGGLDDEDEESPMAGFQSLLDQVGAFLEPWPLLWHYRSRDERLIAFSNRHIYGDGLVTFPGVGGASCVTHVLVEGRPGDEESSGAEVERVVDLILNHAEKTPSMSLGVIAMGLKHAQRIQTALDLALDFRPELEPFFAVESSERFFVKNLEQVQGDERDAIIVSVGYGKDKSGKLPYRFGPLLTEGGERRLNVAVSRARRKMTVVSSFSHRDMDPERSTKRGVELLRAFLEFAATEGGSLEARGRAEKPLNAFEKDIVDALRARGVTLEPKHGVSDDRLDFAIRSSASSEGFDFALETDGPNYHAAATARDRDRLRQQQLEAIGWNYRRLWSTDWLHHREREIEAVLQALTGPPSEEVIVTETSTPADFDRGEPPIIARRESIDLVPTEEIDRLVSWAQSDGKLRTDDDLVDEVADLLGYARKGAKIVRTIQASIDRQREES